MFLSPHKFVGGPQTPGVLVVAAELFANRCRPCRAVARRVRRTGRGSGTSTTRWPGRRAAPRPSSSRSGPAWSSALKEAVGTAAIRDLDATYLRRALDPAGPPTRTWRSSATPGSRRGCRSSRSGCTTAGGACTTLRRRAARRPVRNPGPRRLFVRRPVRPPAARHPPSDRRRCRARPPAATSASSPAGPGSTSIHDVTSTVRLHRRGRRPRRLVRAPAARRLRLRPAVGALAAPGGTGRDRPALAELLSGPVPAPARLGEDALAGQLERARSVLAAGPDALPDRPSGLPPELEALREFHLPPGCLR